MKTKTMKIWTIIATILVFISMIAPIVYGLSPDVVKPVEPTGTEAQTIGGKILGIIQAIGSVLAVVIVAVLGIKYMMGSAEEKAEYKKSMIPYLIGAALVFLAPTIATMVYNFFASESASGQKART